MGKPHTHTQKGQLCHYNLSCINILNTAYSSGHLTLNMTQDTEQNKAGKKDDWRWEEAAV